MRSTSASEKVRSWPKRTPILFICSFATAAEDSEWGLSQRGGRSPERAGSHAIGLIRAVRQNRADAIPPMSDEAPAPEWPAIAPDRLPPEQAARATDPA